MRLHQVSLLIANFSLFLVHYPILNAPTPKPMMAELEASSTLTRIPEGWVKFEDEGVSALKGAASADNQLGSNGQHIGTQTMNPSSLASARGDPTSNVLDKTKDTDASSNTASKTTDQTPPVGSTSNASGATSELGSTPESNIIMNPNNLENAQPDAPSNTASTMNHNTQIVKTAKATAAPSESSKNSGSRFEALASKLNRPVVTNPPESTAGKVNNLRAATSSAETSGKAPLASNSEPTFMATTTNNDVKPPISQLQSSESISPKTGTESHDIKPIILESASKTENLKSGAPPKFDASNPGPDPASMTTALESPISQPQTSKVIYSTDTSKPNTKQVSNLDSASTNYLTPPPPTKAPKSIAKTLVSYLQNLKSYPGAHRNIFFQKLYK